VRAQLSPIAQRELTVEPDKSDSAAELAQLAPSSRAVPIIFIIIGAIAATELLKIIKELLRQFYYGGVVIDTRSQPPTVTNDPKFPADMVFVIDGDGKVTKYSSDGLSLNILKEALKLK
jgi:hypothetical protein